jgi:ferredoxin-nitrate reductase
MASAVVGYITSLGSDGPPPAYEDIDVADCFFLIGTNTAACHPIVFNRIKDRKKANPDTTIIVVDPRETMTAHVADIHLAIRPGSDIPLLNGMMNVLINEGFLDESFITQHTDSFAAVKEAALACPPEIAAEICDVETYQIVSAARAFGRANGALSFWSMGVNQSTVGVGKNHGIINLHLATGKIGTPGNGPFSLTGQPNAMGGREAGGLSHLLPGYRLINRPEDRAELAGYWQVPFEQISPKPGLPAVEMFEAAAKGKIKAIWIACTNPVVSMPNIDVVEAALRQAELVIVQDAYHPTDTTTFAHILLPAAQWSEKEGVMTNSERRITYLPKMVDPPGEALPDWEIFTRFAQAMGFGNAFTYRSASDVFDEFTWLTRYRACDYSGVTYKRLQQEGPLQWPVPHKTDPGTRRLYTTQRFNTANGRAQFHVPVHAEPAETPDDTYPLVLTTGRISTQWHTMTRTGKSKQLMKNQSEPFVELHPNDAEKYGIREGEMVKVASRRGTSTAEAKITPRVKEGVCFMPFHWGRLSGYNKAANNLTSEAVDPVSKEPELKACAVRISPIWDIADVMAGFQTEPHPACHSPALVDAF